MTPIPPKIRKQIDADPFYKTCALYDQHGHVCEGSRITIDHSIIYAGKQLQELWALGPFCPVAHGVDGFKDNAHNKELRLWVALNRASADDLRRISKAIDYNRELRRLNEKWGVYERKVPAASETGKIMPPKESKPFWYPVSKEMVEKVKRIAIFQKEMLGVTNSLVDVIAAAIGQFYFDLAEQIKTNESDELYKKYGFDK